MVKFKATQNALMFGKSDMDLPFVTYNADLLATVAPQLERELTQQLAQKTFTEQAKGILKQLLAGQRPASESSIESLTKARTALAAWARLRQISLPNIPDAPTTRFTSHLRKS